MLLNYIYEYIHNYILFIYNYIFMNTYITKMDLSDANHNFVHRIYIDLDKRESVCQVVIVRQFCRRCRLLMSSSSSSSSCTCRADNSRKNNVRTGRAGVSKITNVALTPVVSGSRERSKLYGASRRMARARHGRDGPIVARSSPAYQSLYTYTYTQTYINK